MSVHFSKGNRNNELGLPLSALGASESDDAVVLEMGMRGFHEIEYLCSIAPPDIAVITNIGISHIELLGSRENILKAKSEITDALRPDGVAVLNGDDDMLQTLKADKKRCVLVLKTKTVIYARLILSIIALTCLSAE